MNVLIISIDKGLVNNNPMGDVVERHKKYGQFCDLLDIIVLNKKDCHPELVSGSQSVSSTVTTYPTNSKNKLFYYFDTLKLAKKLFTQNHHDLIVCQDPFLTGLIGVRLKNKFHSKLLIHFHGDFWQNKNWLKEKWYNFLLLILSKYTVKNSDALRVVSNGVKEKLICAKIDKNKIFVIPTPVDIEKFSAMSVIPAGLAENQAGRAGIPAITEKNEIPAFAGMTKRDNKTLLFVGRLSPEKNLPWFLDVFKNVSDKYEGQIKLIIAGAGSEEQNLKNKVKKLNLENGIDFIGSVSYENLPNLYNKCDLLVLPSLSESFGKVLIEAGASEKPVVATMTTGAKEIVLEGITGFLTPIGDTKSMAEAILKLLNNPELAKQMGASAKGHILENFDGQKNLQKIKEMWQKICS